MARAGMVRCALAALLFGATAPATSRLAGDVPALTLAGLLYLGAALAVGVPVATRPPTRAALAREWRPAAVAVVVGGAVGPVLLVVGLARTSAATASILLNTELAATIVLAAVLFREHLGRRLWFGAALITAAGALLAWEPGAELDVGAIAIVAACVCWGLDNGVTARLEQLAPEHVVFLKGAVAGGTNLALGLALAGLGPGIGIVEIAAALAIGAFGYGISITAWVKGARELGAARAQVIFAAAPFIGAGIAWVALGEPVAAVQLAAVALAAAGVVVSLRSAHEHTHRHDMVEHEHEHVHDDHHDHAPATAGNDRHTHRHHHRVMVHSHPHVPDLHHRHPHVHHDSG